LTQDYEMALYSREGMVLDRERLEKVRSRRCTRDDADCNHVLLLSARADRRGLRAAGDCTQRNPVHSALALIMTLLALAGIYFMLYAPFMAGVQIVLYAGGIMVLFLFVIMLVNLEKVEIEERFNKQWHVATAVVGILAVLIFTIFRRGYGALPVAIHNFPEETNTQQVGNLLYGKFMLPFEVASVLLLVAIVGAVIMAKKRV
jgi:NADH-quinone oxidoreductase subunit J